MVLLPPFGQSESPLAWGHVHAQDSILLYAVDHAFWVSVVTAVARRTFAYLDRIETAPAMVKKRERSRQSRIPRNGRGMAVVEMAAERFATMEAIE